MSRRRLIFNIRPGDKKGLALGLVKQVVVGGLELRRDFYCVYRKERVVSHLLSEFIAFPRARAAQVI